MSQRTPFSFCKRYALHSSIYCLLLCGGTAIADTESDDIDYSTQTESSPKTEHSDQFNSLTQDFSDLDPAHAFPALPGFSVSGASGNQSLVTLDGLIPLFGRSTHFLYTDIQGLYNFDDAYSGSAGLGVRGLTSAGILGASLFADYNRTTNGNNFWFVSPGIERLGESIDFSANAYIPVSQQTVNEGTVYGTQIGINDYVTFQGNTQYDELFETSEATGFGGDAEIGYRLPFWHHTEIYAGGYYFTQQDSDDIKGVTSRVAIPLGRYFQANVSDAYDNVNHNVIKAGLTFMFGGREANSDKDNNDLESRMLDPTHRNLAAIVGTSSTFEPTTETAVDSGNSGVSMSNISFFDNSATINGDGTYEHPYNQFTQETVDDANATLNTNFYINSGTYNTASPITLTNDNVYGRTSYNGNPFVLSAEGDNRPVLSFQDTGFSLIGNNTLDSLQIQGIDDNQNVGISIVNQDDSTVTDTLNNISMSGFKTGVYAQNSSTGTLNVTASNMDITGDQTADGTSGSAGIRFENTGTGNANLDLDHTTLSTFENGAQLTNSGDGKLTAEINQSNFMYNVFVTGSSYVSGNGLLIQNNAGGTVNVNITSSTFDNNGNAGLGARNSSTANESMLITATDSHFDMNTEPGIQLSDKGGYSTLSNTYTTELNLINSTVIDNQLGAGMRIDVTNSQNAVVVVNATDTQFGTDTATDTTNVWIQNTSATSTVTLNSNQALGTINTDNSTGTIVINEPDTLKTQKK